MGEIITFGVFLLVAGAVGGTALTPGSGVTQADPWNATANLGDLMPNFGRRKWK